MTFLVIRDCRDGLLAVQLSELLELAGGDVRRSEWRLSGLECLGAGADALHAAADSGEAIAGARLIELARDVYQVIDGDFYGRLPGAEREWIVIRAVDSSLYELETERPDLLAAIRRRFTDVTEVPHDG